MILRMAMEIENIHIVLIAIEVYTDTMLAVGVRSVERL
jgi:hypothetical protein